MGQPWPLLTEATSTMRTLPCKPNTWWLPITVAVSYLVLFLFLLWGRVNIHSITVYAGIANGVYPITFRGRKWPHSYVWSLVQKPSVCMACCTCASRSLRHLYCLRAGWVSSWNCYKKDCSYISYSAWWCPSPLHNAEPNAVILPEASCALWHTLYRCVETHLSSLLTWAEITCMWGLPRQLWR